MIRKAALIGSALLLTACASRPAAVTGQPSDSAQNQMQNGIKALEKEDYGRAVEIFDRMLKQKPGSEFDLLTLYNDGVAHVGMGDCKRASELYRQAAHGAAALKLARVQAESLYQLSLAYECMGDDRKSIAAMFDTKRIAKNLPVEIAGAELPARLAVAYARIGQRAKALQYFREAGNGLKSALVESGGSTTKIQQKFAARVLYSMGQLTMQQKSLNGDPHSYLKSLSIQQPYLLQSVELAQSPDSRKAADDLIFAYENLLRLQPSDPAQARGFLELALQDIAEIKRIRLPGKGPMVEEVYQKIEVQESRVRRQLMVQAEFSPLTDEAKKREGLKRQGRSVGRSVLEEKNGRSQ